MLGVRVHMFKLIKKTYKKIIISVLVAVVLIIIPLGMDYFILGNSFPSNINNETWANFFASYLGGISTIAVFVLTIRYTENSREKDIQIQQSERIEERRIGIKPYMTLNYLINANQDNIQEINYLTYKNCEWKLYNKEQEGNHLKFLLANLGAGNAIKLNIIVDNNFKNIEFGLAKDKSMILDVCFADMFIENGYESKDVSIVFRYEDIAELGRYEQCINLEISTQGTELSVNPLILSSPQQINKI